MRIFDSIDKAVDKGLDKIVSDKDRAEVAENLLQATKEVDLSTIGARNNINIKNPRFWLEIICVLAFGYNCFLVPILNDFYALSLKGSATGTTELLYALFGLGGYRLAEKVVIRK